MSGHDRSSESHALASETGLSTVAFPVDLLSHVLALVRLRADLIFSAELTSPWALRVDAGQACFHIVTEGETWVESDNADAVHAVAGDLLLMSRGNGHVIGTQGEKPVSLRELLDKQAHDDRFFSQTGGDGPLTRLITGAFRFEAENLPSMLDILPPVVCIPKSARTEEDGWLETAARYLLAEAKTPHHPGAALMISRLVEILVIRTLRTWIRTASPQVSGWLGALADSRISRAVKAIHDEPFRRWTVGELAALAGMSRSSFASRFSALVGAAPLHYQTRWRLILAKDLLQRSDMRVSDVARRIGYESDAAFSRAFKKQFSAPPVQSRYGAGKLT